MKETSAQDPGNRIVSIITGCNRGIGKGILRRLIEMHNSHGQEFIIIMACRDAEKARETLEGMKKYLSKKDKRKQESAAFEKPLVIIPVDLSCPSSVFQFTKSVMAKYTRVDNLYFNAAYSAVTGIQHKKVFKCLFKEGPTQASMTAGQAMIQKVGEKTKDGLGKVFASNVFGHYIIMKELIPIMKRVYNVPCKSLIIYTSSGTATGIKELNIHDFQGLKSELPYETSKKLCEVIALKVADELISDNIHVYVTSPGIAASGLIGRNILHTLSFAIAIIFLKLLGAPGANLFPYYSAYSVIYVTMKLMGTLNLPQNRVYVSDTSLIFSPKIKEYEVSPGHDPIEGDDPVLTFMNHLYEEFKEREQSA